MRYMVILIGLCSTIFFYGCTEKNNDQNTGLPYQGKTLEIFVGSASQPATEKIADIFERKTGAKLLLHFSSSGQMLSKMKLSGRGDIYLPGSSDFMELAKQNKLIIPNTEKIVAYLIPALNVQKGNPKNIHNLEDLAKPGIRVGIARPDTVCVGLYGYEILGKSPLSSHIKSNIVTNSESCAKTVQLVSLKTVDVVFGWRVFKYWDSEHIDTVLFAPKKIMRIGYIPIAVSVFTKDQKLAKAFIEFICSPEGQAIFKKFNYITTEGEARKYTLARTPVGGQWELPKGWK